MKKAAPRWTPSEDEVVRSASLVEAVSLLPGRTYQSIKTRRKILGVKASGAWTKREDSMLLKYRHDPISRQAKRFKGRTPGAIGARRKLLGLTRVRCRPWFGSETKRLASVYPTASRDEIVAAFPRHSWRAIETKALSMGCLRQIKRRTSTENTLYDQVRQRAKEDGIAFGKLGAQSSCGGYFRDGRRKRENYNAIARAVDFFGGRLVIDWQDE